MVKQSLAPVGATQMALTIPAVAERLGCSRSHVYRLIAAGEITKIDISSPGSAQAKTRITPEALADYLGRKQGRNQKESNASPHPRTAGPASRPSRPGRQDGR